MSKRIVDESFVRELESGGIDPGRSSIDERFRQLAAYAELTDAEILASPRGKFVTILKKLVYRLIRPAVRPFQEHRRVVDRDRLELIQLAYSDAEHRITNLEERLLRVYVKTGESMAALRDDLHEKLVSDIEAIRADAGEIAGRIARTAVHEETDKRVGELKNQNERISADIIARTDFAIRGLELQLDTLRYDLQKSLSSGDDRLAELDKALSNSRLAVDGISARIQLILGNLDAPAGDMKQSENVAGMPVLPMPGESSEARERINRMYVEFLRDVSPVADIACKDSGFLSLCTETGLDCIAVTDNTAVADLCKKAGLKLVSKSPVDYLSGAAKDNLGGIYCNGYVERLKTAELMRFFAGCRRVLKKNGVLILEANNPRSLFSLGNYLYGDPSARAVLPEVLSALAEAGGFSDPEIKMLDQDDATLPLDTIDLSGIGPASIAAAFNRINRNIEKLNDVLFGHYRYALIARK